MADFSFVTPKRRGINKETTMGILIADNGNIKICDYNANEIRRRPPITSATREVKIPPQSSYLDAIQETVRNFEKMSKTGASADWVVH